MEKVMKKLIFLLFLITSVVITSNAFAQNGSGQSDKFLKRGGIRNNENYPRGKFFDDLKAIKITLRLSDDQVEKIGIINLDYIKKLIIIQEKMQSKQTKLQSLLLENNVNLNEVRSVLEEISALEVEISMLRINQQMDIEKILASAKTE
jgi:hypothetical protein